jgi:hypothetical protein
LVGNARIACSTNDAICSAESGPPFSRANAGINVRSLPSRRIYAGINGTPMPAHYGMQITEADGTQRPLDENDVWDLVHFVRSLSSHGLEVAQHAPSEAAHGAEH